MPLRAAPLVDDAAPSDREQPRLGHLVAAPVGEHPRGVRERLRRGVLGSGRGRSAREAELVDPREPCIEQGVESVRQLGVFSGGGGRRNALAETCHDHDDGTTCPDLSPERGILGPF